MRTSGMILTLVAVATALAVPTTAAQANAQTPGASFTIRNVATGMCLAIGSGERRKAKPAIQWPCNGGKEQQWYKSNSRLINAATGMCLAIGGGEASKAKPAIQWPCNGGPEQWWDESWHWPRSTVSQIDYAQEHGGPSFTNGATGMCLAIGSGERRKGKTAIQWPCKQSAREQSWRSK
ncbi:RICIN domain-containing protein [Nonomuraea sp. NPDC050556]|uniref:RICIN domain-containing protein n=1 Tax=Nonomuraea sp. NPDC050556 TaxID=3364369 RepID=UPI0037B1DBF1